MNDSRNILSFRYSYDIERSEITAHSTKVRGSPASGKTVLAQLLFDHISYQDPDVHIIWIPSWPKKEERGNYYSYLRQRGWVVNKPTVFIFDEAQATYDDLGLWNEFFKSMDNFQYCRAIVFCSPGSPMSRINIGATLMDTADTRRVTLRSITHEDDLRPVGLLFTRREYDDLVNKHFSSPNFCFDSSFFDAVFNITNGHVGAIHDFISLIIGHDVSPLALKSVMV